MKVRATKTGYYNGLRIPGTDSEEFDVPEGGKSSWFEPVKKARASKSDTDSTQESSPPSADAA